MKITRRQFIQTLGAGMLAGLGGAAAARAAGAGPECAGAAPETLEPGYLALHRAGTLADRAERLFALMDRCRLCPRECGADRRGGTRGFCGASGILEVSSHHPHFGEEEPLVGPGGSGTIFPTHCGLRCVFCINWDISHEGRGAPATTEDLALMMLELQRLGCVNINMVTPTHYSPHIVGALDIAAARGLRLPLVWNTCGWERIEVLELLDGVVDIYLPDFKYADSEQAARYSAGATGYPAVAQAALLEMHRQVGVAEPSPDGLIRRGLMIRHLVMPNGVSGTPEVMRWIAGNLPKDTYVNLMSQYRPAYRASRYPAISRPLSREEFVEAIEAARGAGLTRLDIQPLPRGR